MEIIVYTNADIQRALKFSKEMHKGQLYGDKDYFETHILGVMKMLKDRSSSNLILVVGALHDIYEDSKATREQVVVSFGKEVDRLVWILTRQKDEQYFDYVRRVKMEWFARIVKTEDVAFNYKQSVLSDDESKQKRYAKALLILLGYD